MQNPEKVTTRSDGFLLLDSLMNPVLVNQAAAQILAYPQKPEFQTDLNEYIISRIRSRLFGEDSPKEPAFVDQFRSGRRLYLCRTIRVDGTAMGNSQVSLAVILERTSIRPTSFVQLSKRFRLTIREQEVAHFLLQGLTSKEIGARMQISANTVKAFLRSIMIKMGVSTRSGVVGKALAENCGTSTERHLDSGSFMSRSE